MEYDLKSHIIMELLDYRAQQYVDGQMTEKEEIDYVKIVRFDTVQNKKVRLCQELNLFLKSSYQG